jgi:hypothetical protein
VWAPQTVFAPPTSRKTICSKSRETHHSENTRTMILQESRPKRGDQVIAQKAANDLVLLNMADGNYYSLNEIGGKVWELCDGNRSVSQVIAALAGEYDIPDQVLEADILELLEDFRRGKLIV